MPHFLITLLLFRISVRDRWLVQDVSHGVCTIFHCHWLPALLLHHQSFFTTVWDMLAYLDQAVNSWIKQILQRSHKWSYFVIIRMLFILLPIPFFMREPNIPNILKWIDLSLDKRLFGFIFTKSLRGSWIEWIFNLTSLVHIIYMLQLEGGVLEYFKYEAQAH